MGRDAEPKRDGGDVVPFARRRRGKGSPDAPTGLPAQARSLLLDLTDRLIGDAATPSDDPRIVPWSAEEFARSADVVRCGPLESSKADGTVTGPSTGPNTGTGTQGRRRR